MNITKKSRKTNSTSQSNSIPIQVQNRDSQNVTTLHTDTQDNIKAITSALGNSTDLVYREIRFGKSENVRAVIFYLDGLADTKSISEFVLKTTMLNVRETELEGMLSSNPDPVQLLKESAIASSDLKDVKDLPSVIQSITMGDTVVLIDGYTQGIAISMYGWKERAIEEPSSQTVVRGPREGFTENLRTNTTLIRRKIKDPNLWMVTKKIGSVTQTNVAIMYINGIANESIVQEVHARLDRIQIDGILESGYIEDLIQDETYTPFPLVYNTERPDTIAAGLLEGRVAILVDGTPFGLLVPALFAHFFQASEDYYQRADIATLLRLLRYLCIFISLLGPSLYIAVTTFHQEMLPTTLLISLASQREGVPFPAFVEASVMEVTFEILREAGLRLPRAVGQSVSIVGALVIGQAAVEAGIISAAMVIVVSITAIANFVFPSFNMGISIRILRFIFMLLGAAFGLFGITVGLIAMILHLSSLRSFGIPYLTPFAPFIIADQKDAIFRVPWWGMFSRPRLISQKNIRRESNPTTPKPAPDARKERKE